MILAILAYLGGLLTILSPCILPVLPFIFSRAGQPFRRSGLPLLAGMAITFAAVSTLAVVGGAWVIHANEWGRWIALALLSAFAVTLLSPAAAEAISRPFTKLGGRLSQAGGEDRGAGQSFFLGIATGFLWAPCAGPILGLILTGAALHGASAGTTVLLLAYALGAATSLGAALLVGGKVLGAMKRYLGADVWVRRVLGVAVLLGVIAIALGWDRGLLTGLSRVRTESLEQRLLGWVRPPAAPAAGVPEGPENPLATLAGAGAWINSPPLTAEALKGKVVLIDFWTYSCINCLRTLPYLKAWWEKYKDSGFVIIGVHTPEFAFEKVPANVEKAVRELGVAYPVAIDNQYAIWNGFHNQYWPAHYFIDATGRVRHHHFGEGEYDESERVIQGLLKERQAGAVPSGVVRVEAQGALASSLGAAVKSPETYLGYERSENMTTIPLLAEDETVAYRPPASLTLNQWSLEGSWKVQAENATLEKVPGKILFRFHARDLHLVLGPGQTGRSIPFLVRIDGKAPGEDHGADAGPDGRGAIKEERLYQLLRQKSGDIQDHTFEIEFQTPGAQAFAFTFG